MSIETREQFARESDPIMEGMIQAVESGNKELAAEYFELKMREILGRLPRDNQDLQRDTIIQLEQEIDRLLEPFMEHMEVSVQAEFDLLTTLYEGRSVKGGTQLGTHQQEFITRNADRTGIDHHFKVLDFNSGKRWLVDETTFNGRLSQPCTIMLQDGELVIQQRYYKRGSLHYRPLDPQGTEGRQLMQWFFKDTILAAHHMYTRTPEEITEANQQAKDLTYAHRRRYSADAGIGLVS